MHSLELRKVWVPIGNSITKTHSALVFDTVWPKIAGREFLPNDQGCPREQHLPRAEHSSIGVVEGQGTVDDVIGAYLGHQLNPLLEAVVFGVLDVASLG